MAAKTSDMRKNLFILSSLVNRDFKLKYRRSFLGVLWSVLNPLLMMLVMTAVFAHIFKYDIPAFALYLILGQVLFNYMSAASTNGLWSIIGSAALIKKIRIEKLLFPVEKVISELVNLALSLIAVPLVMVYYHVVPTWRIVMVPLVLIYVTIFAIGLALVLGALAVFFRDVAHLWGVVTLAWMYLTPIFYPYPMPTFPAIVKLVMPFNPMYHFITYFRDIVMFGVTPFDGAAPYVTPTLRDNGICLGAALIMLAIGLLVFRRSEKRFILYV